MKATIKTGTEQKGMLGGKTGYFIQVDVELSEVEKQTVSTFVLGGQPILDAFQYPSSDDTGEWVHSQDLSAATAGRAKQSFREPAWLKQAEDKAVANIISIKNAIEAYGGYEISKTRTIDVDMLLEEMQD